MAAQRVALRSGAARMFNGLGVAWACASLAASAPSMVQEQFALGGDAVPRVIIRFLDDRGDIMYGQPCEDQPGFADLVEGAGATFEGGARGGDLRVAFGGGRARVAKLLAPIPKPVAIYGIGLNYKAHAQEANLTLPYHPSVFFKNRNSYQHPLEKIVVPWQSSWPDYEGELGVVVGPRACRDENASDPASIFGPGGCVLGFTAVNDVSARCWQSDTSVDEYCMSGNFSYRPEPIGQWSFSKSFDTHSPVGPSLLLANPSARWGAAAAKEQSEGGYLDGSGLRLRTYLNGRLMQNTSTDDLIFDVARIIGFISMASTIDAGTLIATGTPSGIGYKQDPPIALQDGDNVTVEIEPRIGSLINFVERKGATTGQGKPPKVTGSNVQSSSQASLTYV